MADKAYLAEIFRVIEGAIRLDGVKVRNYADLLAQKLTQDGDDVSAKRLRRLLDESGMSLRPTKVSQGGVSPVDTESRFPLVELVSTNKIADQFVFSEEQRTVFTDFLNTVQHRMLLEDSGLEANASLLLYGPPGCGKSHLAALAAKQLGLPLYIARLDGLISSFLGSTAKNIRSVFEFAARTPCVLFLDEFDAIAKLRDDQQEMGELKRVVNSFIQALDAHAHELVLIAATNHEQLLDSAIWRRFGFILQVKLPTEEQRLGILQLHAAQIGFGEKYLRALADLSEGFSSAALISACSRLLQRKITQQVEPTLHDAIILLLQQKNSSEKVATAVQSEWLDDSRTLYDHLQKRNSDLYTQSLVGEIAGLSKATMSRNLSVKKLERNGDARRTPVY